MGAEGAKIAIGTVRRALQDPEWSPSRGMASGHTFSSHGPFPERLSDLSGHTWMHGRYPEGPFVVRLLGLVHTTTSQDTASSERGPLPGILWFVVLLSHHARYRRERRHHDEARLPSSR